jgi:hypothetical protein
MKLAEVRARLLQQHAELCATIEKVRHVAQQASEGAPVQEELRALVIGLAGAFLQHNILEQKLLEEASEVDPSTRARAAIFSEEHADEHEELYEALVGIPHTPVEFAGGGVNELLDGILEHMAREETSLLGDNVLRDEAVA